MDIALQEESELEREKSIKYKGTVRIRLKWLYFQPKELDKKRVQHLISCFRKDCSRLNIRNHVPAIINQQDLDSALHFSGYSQGILPTDPRQVYPELTFWDGYKLECLDGRHRIQAAKQSLSPADKWWTGLANVSTYINSELKTALTEEYANEGKPSDGEIYRNIRKYQRENQTRFEMRWWTRLSKHKTKNLKQLLRHRDFAAAFDSLSEIPGLMGGMRLSIWHKVEASKCVEVSGKSDEILRYLRDIYQFWSELTNAMAKIDQATVEALEFTAPWASAEDSNIIRSKVLGGKIFRSFDLQEREGILARLQTYKGLVPSLFGFFEDFKILNANADCLKWLVHLSPGHTLSTAIKETYSINQEMTTALVQQTEATFTSVAAGLADPKDLGYQQLCAFAMRHYRDIPRKPSGKDLLAKPTAPVDTMKLRDMADLADRLGFRSPEITALKQYPKSYLTTAAGDSVPFLVTDGPGEARRDRYGLPQTRTYEEDRRFLFIGYLESNRNEQAEGITSFFRLRSVYLRFYGSPGSSDDHMKSGKFALEAMMPKSEDRGTQLEARATSIQARISEEEGISTSNSSMLDEKAQERQRQELQVKASMLEEQEQQQQIQQQKLIADASVLEEQEQQQRMQQQKLTVDASGLKVQEQQQKIQQQKLISNASVLEDQEQQQKLQQQKLIADASVLEEQEQRQKLQQQKLIADASVLEEQEQRQKLQQQKLIADASVLEEQEQQQKMQQQKLIADASVLEEQQQRMQQQKLIADANLREKEEQEQKWKQEEQQLDIDASLLEEQEQKQAHRRQKLTSGVKALKEQKEQQKQKLAQDTSTFREQQDMDRSRLSPRTQVDIPGLAATDQARQIEVRKNQELMDRLHRTRTGMAKAQTDQPQENRNQQEKAQDNRAAKRQQEDETSDDNIGGQAHEEGRKHTENNKYQRLNKYERSRYINQNHSPSAENYQQHTTPIPRMSPRSPLPKQRQQQHQDIQKQRTSEAGKLSPTRNILTGLASGFTFEPPRPGASQ